MIIPFIKCLLKIINEKAQISTLKNITIENLFYRLKTAEILFTEVLKDFILQK